MRKTERKKQRCSERGRKRNNREREGNVTVAIMMINELHFSCDAMSTSDVENDPTRANYSCILLGVATPHCRRRRSVWQHCLSVDLSQPDNKQKRRKCHHPAQTVVNNNSSGRRSSMERERRGRRGRSWRGRMFTQRSRTLTLLGNLAGLSWFAAQISKCISAFSVC